METQPVLSDNGGGPPTLAQPGVTKARCPKCGTTYTWTIDPLGECPACDVDLVIVATTGETIEQAIAAAAQAMPERTEPRQQTLPGTRPAFDEHGALDLIEAAAREAELAEAASEGAKAIAKRKREAADQANAHLRELIRDLNKRRHDARYEGHDDAPTTPERDDAERDLRVGATGDAEGADVDLERSADVSDLSSDDTGEHVAPVPAADEVTSDEAVIDCSNAGTLALLHRAGADQITLAAVDAWSEAQYTAARAWALEQIEATAHDEPGHHTSVYWPEHVSLAHHGPDLAKHTPKKRTKKQTPRRRAR